jgi:hypothetical protein
MKEYVTAREFMPIISDSSATPTPAENIQKGLKMIEIAVISIDGVQDKLTDLVQDLPLQDYMFITQEVAKLANFQKTKSSDGTSSSSSGAQS